MQPSLFDTLKKTTDNLVRRIRALETNEHASEAGAVPVATVAALPAAGSPGRVYFASNGRKTGEGVGAGTGVLVYDDGTAWRTCDESTTVAA